MELYTSPGYDQRVYTSVFDGLTDLAVFGKARAALLRAQAAEPDSDERVLAMAVFDGAMTELARREAARALDRTAR